MEPATTTTTATAAAGPPDVAIRFDGHGPPALTIGGADITPWVRAINIRAARDQAPYVTVELDAIPANIEADNLPILAEASAGLGSAVTAGFARSLIDDPQFPDDVEACYRVTDTLYGAVLEAIARRAEATADTAEAR